jgi:hypothetical protein
MGFEAGEEINHTPESFQDKDISGTQINADLQNFM